MKKLTHPKVAIRRIRKSGRMAGLAALALAMLLGAARDAHGQRGSDSQSGGRGRGGFDPAVFFKRLDTNGNGTLDDNEISDRTRRYVERYGVDTSQPIKLDDLMAKIQNGSGNSNSGSGNSGAQSSSAPGSSAAGSSTAQGFVRKVPGFDVPKATTTTLPGFAGGASAGGDMSQYSDDIKEQVENVLNRYDANKNRVLDADEIRNARWGQPTPEESDLNRDGSLSVDELARRYVARTQAERAISSSSSSNDQRGDSRSSRSRGDSNNSPSDSNNSDQSNSSSRSQESSTSSSASSMRSSSSEFEKYRSYANGIVEKYDKDDDGKLNAEELKAVRNAPSNADVDGDGMVTAGELADAFQRDAGGGNRGSSSSGGQTDSASSSSSSSRSSDRSSRSSRSSSSRGGSSGGGFSFNSNDANGDGQVQMYEFTDEWSDEKLKEFRALDKNGDGVLTAEEFRGG